MKRVTYVIQQGPTDLFRIEESTGSIFTTRGLDYEKENQHILIIGTLENMSNEKGSTTKVIINVEVSVQLINVSRYIRRPPLMCLPELKSGHHYASQKSCNLIKMVAKVGGTERLKVSKALNRRFKVES